MEDLQRELERLRGIEEFQAGRNAVLEMLVRRAPLEDLLAKLVEVAERASPGLRCAVLLSVADGECLRHGAAQSLPRFYVEAIDGFRIGPDVGSCGAAAALRQRVVVSDVMAHPNWKGYRDLARRAEIRACWSEPVFSTGGEVLGTFAMYYRDVREPSVAEIELIERCAQIAGVVIESERARSELRASEERFRQVTEAIREVFWLTDWREQRVLYVSPGYREIWGRSPQSLIDDPRSWSDDIHPDDRERVVAAFQRAADGSYETEYRLVRADGSVRWIYDRAFPIVDEEGSVYRMAGISEDVTERKRTEQALREANEKLERVTRHKLHSLTTELLIAEERERRRLAVDLHDSLNQMLVLARMKVSALRSSTDGELEQALRDVESILDDANRSARSLTFQLSPPVLHDLGFQAAVQWLAEDVEASFGLRIRLEDTAGELQLGDRVSMLLFRAVRELLINVAKHARAAEAVISIERFEKTVVISVRDDGVAFDPANRSKRGLGLGSIEERLENLGGSMSIHSRRGKGTRIALVAPLAATRQTAPIVEESHS